MSDFFKESDLDGHGTYTPDVQEDTSGIRSRRPMISIDGPMISIDKANRLLRERGMKVQCVFRENEDSWYASNGCLDKTHTALLICIEPIEKDSAEKLIRHTLATIENGHGILNEEFEHFKDRAKKLLENK